METVDVIHRWQGGESGHGIARSMGLARNTVAAYVRAAEAVGVEADGAAPSETQIAALVGGRRPGPARARGIVAAATLHAHRERIGRWLGNDHLRLTRVQELLVHDGVTVSYTTLRRFVAQAGPGRAPRTTVRTVQAVEHRWGDTTVTQMTRPNHQAAAILRALSLSDLPRILRTQPAPASA